jgi:hypothetical protein
MKTYTVTIVETSDKSAHAATVSDAMQSVASETAEECYARWEQENNSEYASSTT